MRFLVFAVRKKNRDLLDNVGKGIVSVLLFLNLYYKRNKNGNKGSMERIFKSSPNL